MEEGKAVVGAPNGVTNSQRLLGEGLRSATHVRIARFILSESQKRGIVPSGEAAAVANSAAVKEEKGEEEEGGAARNSPGGGEPCLAPLTEEPHATPLLPLPTPAAPPSIPPTPPILVGAEQNSVAVSIVSMLVQQKLQWEQQQAAAAAAGVHCRPSVQLLTMPAVN